MTARRLRLALWPIGFMFGLGGALTLARFGHKTDAQLVSDLLGGWAFMVAGLVAWQRLPDRRIGPIAVAVGFAWFIGSFAPSGVPLIRYLAGSFQGWFNPLIAWLALAYPSGRVRSRSGRTILVIWFGILGVWTVARLLLDVPLAWYPCPTCPDSIANFRWTIDLRESLALPVIVGTSASAVGTVLALTHRVASATPVGRRHLAPVALTGILIAIGVVVVEAERALGGGLFPNTMTAPILNALSIGVAAAILAGLLAEQAARSAVADVVGGLGHGATIQSLQTALAAALGDTSLRVLAWDPDAAGYRDELDVLVDPPTADDRRAVLRLGAGDTPVGLVVYDPALRDDPGLASAVSAAVRLHVENARLEGEVRRQLADVRASRARLVSAGDAERRRLEHDLHDGAQQRLVGLALDIRRAQERLRADADPVMVRALSDAATDASLAIDELRELARGIHPSILTEGGLGPAMESLAARSRIPVRLYDDLAGSRFASSIEATAYFVVAEGLTNAAKASGADVVEVRARQEGGRLTIEVADDGSGGADVSRGTGLRGLEDRVTAIGGTLRIDSARGRGTRLSAIMPVDGPD